MPVSYAPAAQLDEHRVSIVEPRARVEVAPALRWWSTACCFVLAAPERRFQRGRKLGCGGPLLRLVVSSLTITGLLKRH